MIEHEADGVEPIGKIVTNDGNRDGNTNGWTYLKAQAYADSVKEAVTTECQG